MKELLLDEHIWKNVWSGDPLTAVARMKQAGMDPARTFDDKAQTFNEQTWNEEGRSRARRIMNWLEGQGVTFADQTVLDIGAASGGFSVPFAERGASVTSVEPNLPLGELLQQNSAGLTNGSVSLVARPFEDIDIKAEGWEQAFDLVFVSMCPVIDSWESVEKVLSCARKFCYISLSVGPREHSLVNELWPLVSGRAMDSGHMEFAYLQQLLLLKGYAYESIVTREMKTATVSREAALEEAMHLLPIYGLPADEQTRQIAADYLERTYAAGPVEISQGGRFGKVLIRLQDQNMYAGK
ncbi:class I SAM-dependent methyltransferase ['Paenibacillus yunnanensis' Narsing Rao et al. 2020]|uniref:class I SAM-dependent methyltransferase n=1 Tax=Paenibacillus tengchongensis TaxID=2608684 RepID=UPI00124BD1B3|nr:class I SAM-dependent methyltransferase [Paenibacillus tengchongensis]